MQTNFSYIKKIAVVSGLVLGAFSLSVLADWSAPILAPNTCLTGNPGCDAPIHVGANGQGKVGSLSIGKLSAPSSPTILDVTGGAVIQGIVAGILEVTGATKTGSLEVTNAATAGSVTTGALKVTTGAANGNYLKSDASGNATWAALPSAPVTVSNAQFINCSIANGVPATKDCQPEANSYDVCFQTASVLEAGVGACVFSGGNHLFTNSGGLNGNGKSVTCQMVCLKF